jgi:hypothetical protein
MPAADDGCRDDAADGERDHSGRREREHLASAHGNVTSVAGVVSRVLKFEV